MLSRSAIVVWHSGHLERGATTDSPAGMREATTLINEPTASPKSMTTIESPINFAPESEADRSSANDLHAQSEAVPLWILGQADDGVGEDATRRPKAGGNVK